MRIFSRIGFIGLALAACLAAGTPGRAGTAPTIQDRRVTVTSGQLLALNATPQTVIPAPGAGKMLVFEGAHLYKPAGVAYGGIAAGEDLSIKYTNGSGAEVAVCETTGFLDQTTAQIRYVRPQTGANSAGTNSALVPVANTPLVIQLLVGEITTGDQPLRVRVFYRVVPSVLN